MKRVTWIGIGFVLLIVGAVIWSTIGTNRYRVEVCMEFQGRSNCRVASASTEKQALQTGVDNACALISSGVTDSIACTSSQPVSVRWLSRP